MRRPTLKSSLSALLLTLGSLALVPSCAENNSSLFAMGVMRLDPATCIAKADDTATLLAGGILDIAFRSNYTGFILVGNQLTERGSREQLRTETSRIVLRGAEVILTTVDGKTTLGNYSTIGTGFVHAASADVPGYSAMSVDIIPSALGASDAVRQAGTVLAKIRVFGDTLGNTAVTSSELDFPIRICEGCLVTYPNTAIDQTLPPGSAYKCTITPSAAQATDEEPPCIYGQDDSFECTACSGALSICRDPAQNPSYGPSP